MLGESPAMSEGITNLPVTISPELVFERHFDFRAGFHRSIENGIHIVRVKKQIDRVGRIRGWRAGHPGKFVAQHQDRIAYGQFGVHNYAAWSGHAQLFLGVEYFLIIFDRPGRTLANNRRSNGMKSFRNSSNSGHKSSLRFLGWARRRDRSNGTELHSSLCA